MQSAVHVRFVYRPVLCMCIDCPRHITADNASWFTDRGCVLKAGHSNGRKEGRKEGTCLFDINNHNTEYTSVQILSGDSH